MTMILIPSTTHSIPLTLPTARHAAADRVSGRRPFPLPSGGQPGERLLGKRVLIVEDEALLALELQLAFEDEGAEVVGPALSLLKALETVAHTAEIDLAVLDVDLGGENIYPIAELLLQRGVPFVFHTGHGSRAQLTQLFPGALTLAKPILPEALVGHLLNLVR